MTNTRLSVPSLTVSFIWTLAGSVIGAGSQWAMLIMLAKLGNSAMVGEYAFAWAVAYPVSLAAKLNLRVLFVNDREGLYPFSRMLGVRYGLAGLATGILLVVCLVHRSGREDMLVLLLVGVALLLDGLSESYYSILQKYERMDRIARSQIIKSLSSLAIAAGLLYFTGNLIYSVCGYLLGLFVTLLAYDAAPETFRIGIVHSGGREKLPTSGRLAAHFAPTWHWKSQVQMFWVAFPLGIVSILVSLSGNMPRYAIEKYLGQRDVGVYSAVGYVPQAAILISTTLGYVAFSRMSKFFAIGDVRAFRILLGKMVLISVALGTLALLISLLAGRQILALLYRPEYAQHFDLLVWLVVTGAVACVATCIGCAMTAASQFRPQVPLSLLVTCVSAALAFALVPHWGLLGAAMTSLAAMLVQLAGAFLILHRALGKRKVTVGARSDLAAVGAFVSES